MKKKLFNLAFTFLVSQIVLAQRNTILIIADDLSPDYFGFYNESIDTANTPNIRALAKNGVVFKKAWGSPLCTVTRGGILTGKFPFRTGLGSVITSTASAQIDTVEMSLAKLLRYYSPQKYNTACIGKWHLNISTPNKHIYPNKCGFDLYSGNFNGAITDYYNYQVITNTVTHTVTTYATTKTVDDAINWIDTLSNSNPFFLWLAFNAPHTPFHVPPSNLTTVTGLTGTTADINNNPGKYFKAALEALDTEIGRLISYLQTSGKLSNTDIVFIGDNGNDIRVSQNANKYKSKNTLYNYGVRVPMIFSGPSVINPNRESNDLVSVTDLFATILEMNNFNNWKNFIPANKAPIDSKSFLEVITNSNMYNRNWIFTQKFTTPSDTNDGNTIRNANYHLMRLNNGKEEFYNQSIDGFENSNLLNTQMTTTDYSNYNQLCDTLYNLIGGQSCSVASISEKSRNTLFTIAPNPASNELMITNKNKLLVHYKIYNSISFKVYENFSSNENEKINLEFLSNGVYLIQIKYNKTIQSFKFIINK